MLRLETLQFSWRDTDRRRKLKRSKSRKRKSRKRKLRSVVSCSVRSSFISFRAAEVHIQRLKIEGLIAHYTENENNCPIPRVHVDINEQIQCSTGPLLGSGTGTEARNTLLALALRNLIWTRPELSQCLMDGWKDMDEPEERHRRE